MTGDGDDVGREKGYIDALEHLQFPSNEFDETRFEIGASGEGSSGEGLETGIAIRGDMLGVEPFAVDVDSSFDRSFFFALAPGAVVFLCLAAVHRMAGDDGSDATRGGSRCGCTGRSNEGKEVVNLEILVAAISRISTSNVRIWKDVRSYVVDEMLDVAETEGALE